MKKYRLKDRDLQRKLDEISNGSLTRMLESGIIDVSSFDKHQLFPLFFGKFFVLGDRVCPQFRVYVYVDDLEEVKE